MLRTFFVLGVLLPAFQLCAQSSDTLTQKNDASGSSSGRTHSPRKAAILSAVIPGTGQLYNKKYWKVPIIYGGFAGLGYLLVNTHKNYVTYRDAYKYRIDTSAATIDAFVGTYTDENLKTLQERYHHRRDLLGIGITLLYFVNIIDAAVDAHLFYFDVSDELSFKMQPYIENSFRSNHTIKGVSLTLKF